MSGDSLSIGGAHPSFPSRRIDPVPRVAAATGTGEVGTTEAVTTRASHAATQQTRATPPAERDSRQAVEQMLGSVERSMDLMVRYQSAGEEEREEILATFKKELSVGSMATPSGERAAMDLQRGLEQRKGLAWVSRAAGVMGDPTLGWSKDLGAEAPISFLVSFAQQDLTTFGATKSLTVQHLNTDLGNIVTALNTLSMVQGVTGVASWIVQGKMIQQMEETLSQMKAALPMLEERGIEGIEGLIKGEMTNSNNFDELVGKLETHGIYLREVNHKLRELGLTEVTAETLSELRKPEVLEVVQSIYLNNYRNKILELHSQLRVQKEMYTDLSVDTYTSVGRSLLSLKPIVATFASIANTPGANAFVMGLGSLLSLGQAIYEYRDLGETQERMDEFAKSAYSIDGSLGPSNTQNHDEYRKAVLDQKTKAIVSFVRERNSWYRLSPKIDADKLRQQLAQFGVDFDRLNKECGPIQRYVDFEKAKVKEGIKQQLAAGKTGEELKNPAETVIKKAQEAQKMLEARLKGKFDEVYAKYQATGESLSSEDFYEGFLAMIKSEFDISLNMQEIRTLLTDMQSKDPERFEGLGDLSELVLDKKALANDAIKSFLLTYVARGKQAISATLKSSMQKLRVDKVKMEKKVSIWRRTKAGLKIAASAIGVVLGVSLVVLAAVGVATASIMTGGALVLAIAGIGIMAAGIYKTRKNRPQAFSALLSLEALKYKFKQFQISRKTYRKLQGDLAENRRLARENTYQVTAKRAFLESKVPLLRKGVRSVSNPDGVPKAMWQALVESVDSRFPNLLRPQVVKGEKRQDFDNVVVSEGSLLIERDELHKAIYEEQVKHLRYLRVGYSLDLGVGGVGGQYRDVDKEVLESVRSVSDQEGKVDSKVFVKNLTVELAKRAILSPTLLKGLEKMASSSASVESVKKYLLASLKKEGHSFSEEKFNLLFEGVSSAGEILNSNFQYNLLAILDSHSLGETLKLVEPAVLNTAQRGVNSFEMRTRLMSGYSQILLDSVQMRQKKVSNYGDRVQFVSRFRRKLSERAWSDYMMQLGYTHETREERDHALEVASEFKSLVEKIKLESPNTPLRRHPMIIAYLGKKGVTNIERFFENWNREIRDLAVSSSSSAGEAGGGAVYQDLGQTIAKLNLKEVEFAGDLEDTSILLDAFAKVFNSEHRTCEREQYIGQVIHDVDRYYKHFWKEIGEGDTVGGIIDRLGEKGVRTPGLKEEIAVIGKGIFAKKFSSLDPAEKAKIKNFIWMQLFHSQQITSIFTVRSQETVEMYLSRLMRDAPHSKPMRDAVEGLEGIDFNTPFEELPKDQRFRLKKLIKAQLDAPRDGISEKSWGEVLTSVAVGGTLHDLRRIPEGMRILSSSEFASSAEFKEHLTEHYGRVLSVSESLELVPEALYKAAQEGSLDQDTIRYVKDQINVDLSSAKLSLDELKAKFKYFMSMDFATFASYLKAFSANQTYSTLRA